MQTNEALQRTFNLLLKPGARYLVKELKVAIGDKLSTAAVLIDIEVIRIKKINDKSVEEITIERRYFEDVSYKNPIVTRVLLQSGQKLEPGNHGVLEYVVEESFGNLIEIAVLNFCRTPSNLYFSTKIPDKKLTKAIQKYAKSVDKDRVLFLYDDTLFGTATEGFIITDSAFYYRNSSTEFNFRFNDVVSTEMASNEVIRSGNTILEPVLLVRNKGGDEIKISENSPAILIKPMKELIDYVTKLKADGYTKDVDGYIIIQDMPDEIKINYLKSLVWLTFNNDGTIDQCELSELQVLMTQLEFGVELRRAIRQTIESPENLDINILANEIMAKVPSGSELALSVSLLKDAIRIHRAAMKSSALENRAVLQLAEIFKINKDQLLFIEEACIQDERILAGELSDDQITAMAKDLSSKAAAVGIPIAAVYLSGSVVGLSAAGITSGLAALGLGGVLGLSSMVTGIGVAILIGVGVYKGMQWLMGGTARDKASRREIMLQEVLRIHQKAIANLAEDIAFFAQELTELIKNTKVNELIIDKLSKEITIFANALKHLRTREDGFEQNLLLETNKRAT